MEPPPPPGETAIGVPPIRASAMVNIFVRSDGFASWSRIVSNVDFRLSLFSVSDLTSFRNWKSSPKSARIFCWAFATCFAASFLYSDSILRTISVKDFSAYSGR